MNERGKFRFKALERKKMAIQIKRAKQFIEVNWKSFIIATR